MRVSMIAVMEPGMIGVMEPVGTGGNGISNGPQNGLF